MWIVEMLLVVKVYSAASGNDSTYNVRAYLWETQLKVGFGFFLLLFLLTMGGDWYAYLYCFI